MSDQSTRATTRIYQDIPVGLCHVDDALRFVDINAWLASLNDLPAAEYLGRTFGELFPYFGDGIERSARQVIETGQSISEEVIEGVSLPKSEIKKTFKFSYLPVRSEDSTVRGVTCVVHDITELKGEPIVLGKLLENIGMGVTVWDKDLRLITSNGIAEEMLEFPAGSLVPGASFEQLSRYLAERGDFGEGDVEEQVRERVELARRFEAYEMERERPDGSWLDIRRAPMPGGGFVSTHLDITKRKRAEKAPRDSEESYRLVVENAPYCIHQLDLQGRFLSMNPAGLEMLGASSEDEVLGMPCLDLVCDEDKGRIEGLLRDAFNGRPSSFEFRGNGDQEFESSFIPLVDRDGHVMRLMGISQDISKRRRLERKSARDQKLLEVIAEAQSAFILGDNPEHLFNDMLTSFLSLLDSEYGFLAEVLRDSENYPYLKTYAITNIAWNEETRQLYDDHVAEGLEFANLDTLFGKALTSEKPVIANDAPHDPRRGGVPEGHPALNAFMGIPLFAGDKMVGLLGVANRAEGYTDELVQFLKPLTETLGRIIEANQLEVKRIEAEEAKAEQDARSSAVIENAADGIITISEMGMIESVNSAAEDLFGYVRSELIGKNIKVLMPQPYSSEHDGYLENYRATGFKTMIDGMREVQGLRKNGSIFPMKLSVGEVVFGDQRLFTGIVHDLSRESQLESQLFQAQKMEALGQLTGGIAHDFNNVLQSILAYSKAAQDSGPEDEKTLQECLKEIERGGHRATDMVARLLDFSRAKEVRREALSLGSVAREALKLFGSTVPANVKVCSDLSDEGIVVLANETQIHQIVLCLCTNAIQAMEGKSGTLTIEMTNVTLEEIRNATTGRLELREYALLEVADTGIGIAPEILDSIFDPFFTTKDVGVGTGLGLATVHGIVSSMGGAIDVDSTLGKGTSFKIYLPLYKESAPAPNRTVGKHESKHRGSGRILFVDDEVSITKVAQIALSRSGFTVDAFTSPNSAIEAFGVDPDSYSFVVTDLAMPEISGLELARRIRSLNETIPIILATGKMESEIANDSSVTEILYKPYDMDDIVQEINRQTTSKMH